MACLAPRRPSNARPPERRLALQRVCAPPPLLIFGPELHPAPVRRTPARFAATRDAGGAWAAAATAAAAAATAALAGAHLPACSAWQRPRRATALRARGGQALATLPPKFDDGSLPPLPPLPPDLDEEEYPLPPPLPPPPPELEGEKIRTLALPGSQGSFTAWQVQWPDARDLMRKWAVVSDCPDAERALLKKLADGRGTLARAVKAQRMSVWAVAVPDSKVAPGLHDAAPDRSAEALVMAENVAAGTKSGWGGSFEDDCFLIHHVLLRPTSWEAERAELEAPSGRRRRAKAAKRDKRADSADVSPPEIKGMKGQATQSSREEEVPPTKAAELDEDADSTGFASEESVGEVEAARPKAKAKAENNVNNAVARDTEEEAEDELASMVRGRRAKGTKESDNSEDVETLSFLQADSDETSEDPPAISAYTGKAARSSGRLGRRPRLIDGEDAEEFAALEAKLMAEMMMREESEFDDGDATYAIAPMAKFAEGDTTYAIAPMIEEPLRVVDSEESLRGAVRAWVESLAPKVVAFRDPEDLEQRGLHLLLAAETVDPLAGCGF